MKRDYGIQFIAFLVLSFINISAQSQIITTFAGGGTGGDGGPATTAALGLTGLGAFDGMGNYYFFQDFGSPKIRMVDVAGIIHTMAGSGLSGFGGDGGPATAAKFHQVEGIAVDLVGNIYVADGQNFRIRKVDATTHIINTIAGIGMSGFSGDGGQATAAKIAPGGICIDTSGNIYFSGDFRIRKIDPSGIITTIAGNGSGGITGFTGDGGQATGAEIGGGAGICVDDSGNLYFGGSGNWRIRKVNIMSGIISTIAGNGISGTYNGEGMHADSAQFVEYGICKDGVGNIYISDYGNQRIRKIDTFGIIHTIAGTGTAGFSGDGGTATSAQINRPEGVAVDACGNVYIADDLNHRIRKVTFTNNPTIALNGVTSAAIGSSVTVTASLTTAGTGYSIKWYNKGILFTTTTTPIVTYTKTMCTDSITAMVYGCSDSAMSSVHVVRCNVGMVSPVPARGGMACYPNPARDELIVFGPEKISSVAITNLLGQVVALDEYQGENEISLHIDHLPSGVYIVKVNGLYLERLVKE